MTVRERLAASVTDIRDRGQRLARLNRELLASELKQKGGRFGGAIGLFAGAGLVALYAVGFALATIAVALALVLPLWLSLLIVTVVLFLVVLIMVLVGRSLVRKAQTPAPEAAITEGRITADLIKVNVRETVAGVRARMQGRPLPREGQPPPVPSPAPGPTPTPVVVPTTGTPDEGSQQTGKPDDTGASDR